MHLALSEEQEMLWKPARDFWASKAPKTLVRQMEEDEKGELWTFGTPLKKKPSARK
jgi:hypothetical protein